VREAHMEQPIFSFSSKIAKKAMEPRCPACGDYMTEIWSKPILHFVEGDETEKAPTGLYRCLGDYCDTVFDPNFQEPQP